MGTPRPDCTPCRSSSAQAPGRSSAWRRTMTAALVRSTRALWVSRPSPAIAWPMWASSKPAQATSSRPSPAGARWLTSAYSMLRPSAATVAARSSSDFEVRVAQRQVAEAGDQALLARGPAHALLGALARGDVARDRHDHPAVGRVQRAAADLDVDTPAVQHAGPFDGRDRVALRRSRRRTRPRARGGRSRAHPSAPSPSVRRGCSAACGRRPR